MRDAPSLVATLSHISGLFSRRASTSTLEASPTNDGRQGTAPLEPRLDSGLASIITLNPQFITSPLTILVATLLRGKTTTKVVAFSS